MGEWSSTRRCLVSFGWPILLLALAPPGGALSLDADGQVSAWALLQGTSPRQTAWGLRYLPNASLEQRVGAFETLRAQVTLNLLATAETTRWEARSAETEADLYRGWIRYAAAQGEARLGLQRISFGSASLLRPLRWFDRIDPRDPLQLTDGVYALLLRAYLLTNANLWLWGLYGNEDPRGWDMLASDEVSVEYGGRLQLPLPAGEAGVAYHHRRVDLQPWVARLAPAGWIVSLTPRERYPVEDRVGFDGKWDLGVGAWVEAAWVHQETDRLPDPWQRYLAGGLDYTFEWGKGLTVLAEHMLVEEAEEALGRGDPHPTSALSASYPLGVIHHLRAILYYDWEQEEAFRFLDWRQTYDRWRLHVIGFWNPQARQIFPSASGAPALGGRGLHFLLAFHH